MKRTFGTFLASFLLATVMVAYALPTMAGRIVSYNGSTGILVLELEDKSVKKFQLTGKTKVEWMGRNATASSLRTGSKVSVQIAGALNASPLAASKIVDWGSSETIIAKAPIAPEYTPVAQYATTSGGGGAPDGAPKMNSTAHQDMAAIAHGGSQNQPRGPVNGRFANSNSYPGTTQSYPSSAGSTYYTNQGQSMTAPLEMMNIDPYSSNSQPQMNPMTGDYTQMGMGMDYNTQMGMGNGMNGMDYNSGMGSSNDVGAMMGINNDADGNSSGMMGQETAYGNGTERITGQVLESAIEQGYIVVQSFEHPNLLRVLLGQANAATQLLMPGQMIEVIGEPTPAGIRAIEIKAAQGGF